MRRLARLGGVVLAAVLLMVGLAACEPPTVTATFEKAEVNRGQPVVLTGQLSSGQAGQAVVIERLAGSKWAVRAQGKTTAQGKFRIAFTATEAGALRFRARIGSVSSPDVFLRVLRTVYLVDEPGRLVGDTSFYCAPGTCGAFTVTTGLARTHTVEVNGKQYQFSYAAGNTELSFSTTKVLDIDLKRATSRFTATIGMIDSTPSATVTSYRLILDGTTVKSGTVKLGQTVPVDLNVRGKLRLRIEAKSVSSIGGAFAVGSPKVTY